jgi:hypothetical protein
MAESYDVAHLHPEIVQELISSLEEQMPGFPPKVVAEYAALKERKGDWSTPTGASPRPNPYQNPPTSYLPPDRQPH